MPRARNLKPSFFVDDEIAELPPLTRLLFQGLWCVADRAGRMVERVKRIKTEVLPYDDCDIEAMLAQLAAARFIVRYELAGVRYIEVRQFAKHQHPHVHEASSTLPTSDDPGASIVAAPDKHGASTVQAPDEHETSTGQARLIVDCGLLIVDSLLPQSGASTVHPIPPASLAGLGVAPELWNEFRKVRKKQRAAMTPYAEGLIATELEALRRQGHDPTKVVEQSITRGWKGVFPIELPRRNGEPTRAAKLAANVDDICGGNRERTVATGDMDREALRALPRDLRQPDEPDLGGDPEDRSHGGLG